MALADHLAVPIQQVEGIVADQQDEILQVDALAGRQEDVAPVKTDAPPRQHI